MEGSQYVTLAQLLEEVNHVRHQAGMPEISRQALHQEIVRSGYTRYRTRATKKHFVTRVDADEIVELFGAKFYAVE